MSEKNIILIGGPTASGKSALASQIARLRNGRIINADAMQVYAGLPLLTAQPAPQDKAQTPHLLYEVSDAAEASSAGKWLILAEQAIMETLKAGCTPILVGGTGMYFGALLGGLAEIPPIPAETRAEATALYDNLGEESFRLSLAQKDPSSASRIARNDRQRLIRAYEVSAHTNKPLSEWQNERTVSSLATDIVFEKRLLLPPRDELYTACDARLVSMLEHGAIDEVKNLISRNLSPELPAMKILGVREIATYLRGEISLKEATEKAQQATRNYAKRQMTWFRNQWSDTPPVGAVL